MISSKMKSFEGIHTALITPMKPDGAVDFKQWEKLIIRQLEAKIHGLVPCGTTGESPTLSKNEKIKMIDAAVSLAKNSGTLVIAGTGSNNTQESVEFTKAVSKKVDACLIVTPYYNKPSQAGLCSHFKMIADNSKSPIILYNVPGRTITNLSVSTISFLSKHKNIVGIKEASGNLAFHSEIRKELGLRNHNFYHLTGDDPTLWPYLMSGGNGAISVASNILPKTILAIYNHAKRAEINNGLTLFEQTIDFIKALFIEANPVPSKYILNLMKHSSYVMRLPLVKLSSTNEKKLKKIWTSLPHSIKVDLGY